MNSDKVPTPLAPEENMLSRDTNKKLGESALRSEQLKEKFEDRFRVNPDDYPIFSRQVGVRRDEITGELKSRQLSIDETMSLMTGRTAGTVAVLAGEKEQIPPADKVIYLDKSARPVSWLVNEFWRDFTDKPQPQETFLAIDRKAWFPRVGIKLSGNEEIELPDGSRRVAKAEDFWKAFDENISEDKRKTLLAKIRCLYIQGGIEKEDPDTILNTPTELDGKNITIIDEVSRSGSTLGIAVGLIKRAFPEVKSVNEHVFWIDTTREVNGETQMGNTPVWYPRDISNWYGRGVKDIDQHFYDKIFEENPTPINRANKYGAFVLGVPLRPGDEPNQESERLRTEMKRIHSDYQSGRILPELEELVFCVDDPGSVQDHLISRAESLGVEFCPESEAKNSKATYTSVIRELRKIK